MITPEEIKKKALQIWDSGRFLKAWCRDEKLFPFDIPSGISKGSYISDNYIEVSSWINNLIDNSKDKIGYGYSVGFTTVIHRHLGKQELPERIFINSENDFLELCRKKNELAIFREILSFTDKTLPSIRLFMEDNSMLVLKHAAVWENLVNVCLYFCSNPEPRIYIRQIVIPGINTKFIEKYIKVITDIMTFIYPERYSKKPADSANRFEKQFHLLYDQPLIRFRILDSDHNINNISDLSLPLPQFNSLKLTVKNIFITENKINGLSFPSVSDSIVIFGLGYGIQILKDIPWLTNKNIYYWGDIDTHGFSILSMLRGYFPDCRSFLMDEKTLLEHKDNWSSESDIKKFTGDLIHLNNEELNLFKKLKDNSLGLNLRLEQELIGFNTLLETLKKTD